MHNNPVHPAAPHALPAGGEAETEETEGSPDPAKRTGSGRKGLVTGLLSAAVIMAGAGAVVAAGSFLPQPGSSRSVPAGVSAVPAGTSVGVCPGPARLLEGTEAGTDPQFSPESETAASTVTGAVLSAGGVLPASRLSELSGRTAVEIAKGPGPSAAAGAPQELLAGVVAGRQVNQVSVLSADATTNQKASAHGNRRRPAGDGSRELPAALERPMARRCQYYGGPHVRADAHQRFIHTGHREPGAVRVQRSDPGAGKPRPACGARYFTGRSSRRARPG